MAISNKQLKPTHFLAGLIAVAFVLWLIIPDKNKPDAAPAVKNEAQPAPPPAAAHITPTTINPTYVIEGAYPGMSVLAAKEIGFKNCQPFQNGMRCSKPITTGYIGELPITDFSITLEDPYSEVKEVEIVFDTKKHTKECKPQKQSSTNPWADVITGDCVIDAGKSLISIFGEPKTTRRTTKWHNCNAYLAEYNGTTLTLSKNDNNNTLHQQECTFIEEHKIAEQGKLDKQNNLKKLMK